MSSTGWRRSPRSGLNPPAPWAKACWIYLAVPSDRRRSLSGVRGDRRLHELFSQSLSKTLQDASKTRLRRSQQVFKRPYRVMNWFFAIFYWFFVILDGFLQVLGWFWQGFVKGFRWFFALFLKIAIYQKTLKKPWFSHGFVRLKLLKVCKKSIKNR